MSQTPASFEDGLCECDYDPDTGIARLCDLCFAYLDHIWFAQEQRSRSSVYNELLGRL